MTAVIRVAGLFEGYGGLTEGIRDFLADHDLPSELAWYSEFDGLPTPKKPRPRGACAVLAHRFPGVPNHGDVTTIDWATLGRHSIEVLSGGSPCQDLSHAGKRAGMTTGTRSNLWVAMREAIAHLRPAVVVWENVRGALSAEADSDLEHCPGCMGDPQHREPPLRALGRVVGDLSDLGYDVRWHSLRAADIGAPHARFRVFLVATDAACDPRGLSNRDRTVAAFTGRLPARLPARRGGAVLTPTGPLLGTPTARDGKGDGQDHRLKAAAARGHVEAQVRLLPTPEAKLGSSGPDYARADREGTGGDSLHEAVGRLLPTPAVNDMGAAYTPETWDAWTAKMKAEHGNGNGHGDSLAIEAQRLLPTPVVTDAKGARNSTSGRSADAKPHADGDTLGDLVYDGTRWGDYAPAIHRWENVLGRPAPDPTVTSKKGTAQLSAAFTEWMMGIPAGWITDTPGITRNEALKLCGNGVVSLQARSAFHTMATWKDPA